MNKMNLSSLIEEVPALNADAEGVLRGGFSQVFVAPDEIKPGNESCEKNVVCDRNTVCSGNTACKNNKICTSTPDSTSASPSSGSEKKPGALNPFASLII